MTGMSSLTPLQRDVTTLSASFQEYREESTLAPRLRRFSALSSFHPLFFPSLVQRVFLVLHHLSSLLPLLPIRLFFFCVSAVLFRVCLSVSDCGRSSSRLILYTVWNHVGSHQEWWNCLDMICLPSARCKIAVHLKTGS